MSPKYIEQKNLKFAPKPDITILLDISPQTAKERFQGRDQGKNDFGERLEPVRDIFIQIVANHPEMKMIDGEKSIAAVGSKILSTVLPVLRNIKSTIKAGKLLQVIFENQVWF